MNLTLTPIRFKQRAVREYGSKVGIIDGDKRFTYAQYGDGTVRYWDTTGAEFRSLDFQRGRLTSMAIAPDGLRAIVGTDRGTIVIWDLV